MERRQEVQSAAEEGEAVEEEEEEGEGEVEEEEEEVAVSRRVDYIKVVAAVIRARMMTRIPFVC